MNFLDTYDLAGPQAATPPAGEGVQQQSLNEEVNQVVGQISRFWGGFRKQVSCRARFTASGTNDRLKPALTQFL